MTNLLEGIKNLLTDEVLGKASSLVGMDKKSTSSAVETFLPAIIGRVANMGSNSSGAVALLDLFKSKKLGGTDLGDLTSILSNKDKSSNFLQLGGQLIETIFGRSQNTLLDKLIQMTGIKKAGGSMLMKFLLPIVLKKLAGLALGNNWGASKLSSYLTNQGKLVSPLTTAFSAIPGFGNDKTTTSSSSSYTSSNNGGSNNNGGGGMGWLKWLLPLLLALGLIYFLTKDGCSPKSADTGKKTEVVSTGTSSNSGSTTSHSNHDGHDHAGHDHAGHDHSGHNHGTTGTTAKNVDYTKYTVNANGDIVDGNGKVIYPNGSYYMSNDGNILNNSGSTLITKNNLPSGLLAKIKSYLGKYSGTKLSLDANGNLVDSSGKILFKKGEFTQKNGFYYDNQGNKLGRIWEKIVKAIKDGAAAIKDGAEKTVEGMKSFFTDLVTKKPNAKTAYTLSNITFNPENHRITNYSKAEVEGLAQALKANKNGKVIVRAYSADAGTAKANKKLTKTRAEVIYNMLVTLGVDKSQLSFEGMGASDAAKAATDFIEIVAK